MSESENHQGIPSTPAVAVHEAKGEPTAVGNMIRTIWIAGPRGSGKSTFGRLLAAALQRPHVEGSDLLMERLARIYQADEVGRKHPAQAHSLAEHIELIKFNKEIHRPALLELGNQYADVDPGYLPRFALESAGSFRCVVSGIRRSVEVRSIYRLMNASALTLQDEARALNDVWIFIEKPGVGLEVGVEDRRFFEQFCHYHIHNCGKLADLEAYTAAFAAKLKGGGA